MMGEEGKRMFAQKSVQGLLTEPLFVTAQTGNDQNALPRVSV